MKKLLRQLKNRVVEFMAFSSSKFTCGNLWLNETGSWRKRQFTTKTINVLAIWRLLLNWITQRPWIAADWETYKSIQSSFLLSANPLTRSRFKDNFKSWSRIRETFFLDYYVKVNIILIFLKNNSLSFTNTIFDMRISSFSQKHVW